MKNAHNITCVRCFWYKLYWKNVETWIPPGSHCFITLETGGIQKQWFCNFLFGCFCYERKMIYFVPAMVCLIFFFCNDQKSQIKSKKYETLSPLSHSTDNHKLKKHEIKWMHLQNYSTKVSSVDAYSQVLGNSQSNFVWFSQLSFLHHWDSRTLYHLHTLIHS